MSQTGPSSPAATPHRFSSRQAQYRQRTMLILTTLCTTLCVVGCDAIRRGGVLFTEDTQYRYVQLRRGRCGAVISTVGHVANRPELKQLREVEGDLMHICSEINGVENPRIVVESRNKACYQVVYPWGDREALKVIATPLALEIAEEDRNFSCLTIRVARTGHRLKPSVNSAPINVEDVAIGADDRWQLDGVSLDELARFLETRYRRPVVNMSSLPGHWSIVLSHASTINWPNANQRVPLDDLGLDLQWEQVTIPVTVVRDKVK